MRAPKYMWTRRHKRRQSSSSRIAPVMLAMGELSVNSQLRLWKLPDARQYIPNVGTDPRRTMDLLPAWLTKKSIIGFFLVVRHIKRNENTTFTEPTSHTTDEPREPHIRMGWCSLLSGVLAVETPMAWL